MVYRDSIAYANNAYSFFAHSGYVISPLVEEGDELDYNDLAIWPSLVQELNKAKTPEWTAYWQLLTNGEGQTNITAMGENPYNTMQFKPDEEIFAWFTDASFEDVELYRLNVILPVEGLTLTVNIDPQDAGTVTISPEKELYDPGDEVTLTAEPAANYSFIGWYIDDELVGEDAAYNLVMGEEDVVITAKFEISTYTITTSADPEEGGNVTGSGVYFKNEQVALSAEPAEGYTFLYWTKDGEYVSALSPYSFISNENVEYVAHFEPLDGRYIGDGSANLTNEWVPSYSYYKYSLTQQIYTADEIGEEGSISSLSFFNGGETKTRNFDIYLVPTSKMRFENNQDWISTTDDDRVFSGEVSLTKGAWTEIVFDTPFDYDGVSNLALIVDDNTGNWSNAPHLSCRVFNTNGTQALRVYSDNDDFDPLNPVNQTGTLLTVKNQIILHQSGHVAHLVPGWNWYSSYMEYHDGSLEAIENCIAATSSTAMIKSQGGGFANLNNHIWTGVLRDLSNKQMYLIMVGEDADVTLQGGKVNPANCPITLFSGWNWISCLLDKETPIADALVNLTPVNGQESNSTFLDGQWRGTLQSLKPGQGYIYLRNGSTVTFTYPSTVTPQR